MVFRATVPDIPVSANIHSRMEMPVTGRISREIKSSRPVFFAGDD
jgi:hypothetical protein